MTLMSPTPRHPHPLRRRGRTRGGARAGKNGANTGARNKVARILVLLVVALLATGPHPEAFTAPMASAAVSGGAEGAAEHDAPDTALRPPHRQAHRPLAPPRPAAPRHSGRHPRPTRAAAPTGPAPSPTLNTLRCVVLRC
ncbi:hypothetical protein [Streptomyces sp. NPDC099088]|uniref:hypothetical protein n=1 Tax=Streptomyces sp. NPDC099088 TaxID=3366101 RepID=UPI00380E0E87